MAAQNFFRGDIPRLKKTVELTDGVVLHRTDTIEVYVERLVGQDDVVGYIVRTRRTSSKGLSLWERLMESIFGMGTFTVYGYGERTQDNHLLSGNGPWPIRFGPDDDFVIVYLPAHPPVSTEN